MGCCVSKKETGSSTVSAIPTTTAAAAAATTHSSSTSSIDTHKLETQIQVQKNKVQQQKVEEIKEVQEEVKTKEEDTIVKKEVFVIKHRKSHDKERPNEIEDEVCNVGKVRTSSCSKEEVDAILIQCGRLSRGNSSGKANSSSAGKKYSGSKRSYDFDVEEVKGGDEGDVEEKRELRHRERRCHSRPSSSSPSGRRRRTPSRERDLNQQQQQLQQRSGSRDRSGGDSRSRRVSRSPGRRSDTNNGNANANGATGTAKVPGKMVPVPPKVSSSSSLERSNNGGESAAVKRISVKRNVGGETANRGVASPRSQSPARANAKENQQQQSLSRSSSRKAEHSPYRRNPLSEIDPNSLAYPQYSINKLPGSSNNNKCKEIEAEAPLNQKQNLQVNNGEGNNQKKGNRGTQDIKDVSADFMVNEQQQSVEEAKRQATNVSTTTTVIIPAGTESLKPQTITRSKSSRRSRDLDINPDALLNAEPSYTRLLLEDIQNFHQKSTNANINVPSLSLPACVSKACSILEAVADLNSTTSSNLSCAFSDDRKGLPTDHQSDTNKGGYTFVGKKAFEAKDPFIESDLMEPSFHKYVTVRRGGTLVEEEDMDEQESSGSNSFSGTGAQQNWGMSSSSWEPSSVDSAGYWTSRFTGREGDHSNTQAFQRQGFPESGHGTMDEARRGKRNRGIGRNMVVSGDGFLATPAVAATASI